MFRMERNEFTIIPPLTLEEALQTTKIHSVAGKIDDHTSLMTGRPFRSPHHTISDVVLKYYVANQIYLTMFLNWCNFHQG